MEVEGGCYCAAVRYRLSGDPLVTGQCHCRQCQYISGGNPNVFVCVPEAGFTYTHGTPKQFRRKDLELPVTREFCVECGTHLVTRAPIMPGAVIVKVGTLDQPCTFGAPQVAINLTDAQPFHHVLEGVQCFNGFPPG